MILQIDDLPVSADKIMEITPYNAMAWGALVLLLVIIVIYVVRDNIKKQNYLDADRIKTQEILSENIAKLTEISIRLDDQKHIVANQELIKQYVMDIKHNLENMKI